MLDVRTLSRVQLVAIVTEVQKILWQESKPIPEFPREYGDYWNPCKEDDGSALEQIADVLADADLKPDDCMPVDVPAEPQKLLDANELLWAARVLAARNAVPENIEVAAEIIDSYSDLPAFDPCDQRWTIAK